MNRMKKQVEKRQGRSFRFLIIMTIFLYLSWVPFVVYGDQFEVSCIGIVAHFMLRADGLLIPWLCFATIEQYRNGLKKVFRRTSSKQGNVTVATVRNIQGQGNDAYKETRF